MTLIPVFFHRTKSMDATMTTQHTDTHKLTIKRQQNPPKNTMEKQWKKLVWFGLVCLVI